MAQSPRFKVYSEDNEYIASTTRPDYAAMIIAGCGQEGMTIRDGHSRVLWIEGAQLHPAAESYDYVAQFCYGVLSSSVRISYTGAMRVLAAMKRASAQVISPEGLANFSR